MVDFTGSKWAKILQMEIDKINNHLPKGAVTLEIALQGKNEVSTRDHGKIIFSKSELEYLSSLLPKTDWNKLRLPIIILRRRDLGNGIFTVAGSKLNYEVCLAVLGKSIHEKDQETVKRQILYRLDIQLIRKRLPNTTVIGLA